MENKILQGNCLDVLKTLQDESIDCIVTSPPYWALRDYNTDGIIWDGDINCDHSWIEHVKKPTGGKGSIAANVGANRNDNANMRDHDIVSNFCNKCGAWKGSFGLEPTFDLYVKHLCDIFDEIKRVLKKDGTCWVNIGDTYGGSGDKGDWKDPKNINGRNGQSKSMNKSATQKSLCQIPSRFAIEMTNRGWILRNEIIWHKPNAMPSSVKDRFTVDFEKVFFFTKNKKYHFECIREGDSYYKTVAKEGGKRFAGDAYIGNKAIREDRVIETFGRNKRTVWTVATKPFREAHFATYPESLIEPMIKAGCKVGGIVLDPFFGAGTTAVVALKQDKKYLGIELNKEYIKIAENRLKPLINKLF